MRRFPIFRLTHEVIGRFLLQAIYHCPAVKQTFVQAGEMPDRPSRVREIAASALIAVGLVVVVLFNLPASAITRATAPVVNAIALPLGLDQNWALFAPTPPTRQEDVEVYVTMADGDVKAWVLPRSNRVLGVPTTHRWRKFKESLLTKPEIRPDFAHWVVERLTGPDDRPVRVDMILRSADMPAPGSGEPGQTAVESLYSEDLAGPR